MTTTTTTTYTPTVDALLMAAEGLLTAFPAAPDLRPLAHYAALLGLLLRARRRLLELPQGSREWHQEMTEATRAWHACRHHADRHELPKAGRVLLAAGLSEVP